MEGTDCVRAHQMGCRRSPYCLPYQCQFIRARLDCGFMASLLAHADNRVSMSWIACCVPVETSCARIARGAARSAATPLAKQAAQSCVLEGILLAPVVLISNDLPEPTSLPCGITRAICFDSQARQQGRGGGDRRAGHQHLALTATQYERTACSGPGQPTSCANEPGAPRGKRDCGTV